MKGSHPSDMVSSTTKSAKSLRGTDKGDNCSIQERFDDIGDFEIPHDKDLAPLVSQKSPSLRVLLTISLPPPIVKYLRHYAAVDIKLCPDNPAVALPQHLLKAHAETQQYDAVFCTLNNSFDKEIISTFGDRLKVISTMSVGYNHIDIAEADRHNVIVGHTPDVLTNAMADLTIGLMIATARRFSEGIQTVQSGQWGYWRIFGFLGKDIHGSCVGIVGLGRIGLEVSKRLKTFGCNIIYTAPHEKPEQAATVDAKYYGFDEFLGLSDYVLITCPLNADTKNMFDSRTFKLMKKDSILINTSRGGIVNHDDLLHALKTGEILAAGLDVTDPEPLPLGHELLSLPNCTILPHVGSATRNCRLGMATLAAQNVVYALYGKPEKGRYVNPPK